MAGIKRALISVSDKTGIIEMAKGLAAIGVEILDGCFEQAGVQPKIIVEMNSIEGILATVRRSNLATVLPRLSLGLARNQTLRAITLKNPTPRRGIGLLWKKGGYRSGAAKALTDQVRAVVAEHWRS